MLDWIVFAGCVGGIVGFVFAVVVLRGHAYLARLQAEHRAAHARSLEAQREIAITTKRISTPPAAARDPGYVNGAAHASLDA